MIYILYLGITSKIEDLILEFTSFKLKRVEIILLKFISDKISN